MTVQAAGVGTTVAATVLGVTAQRSGATGAAPVRDQLALTGVGHMQILLVVGLMLLLAGALIMGLARRHALVDEPSR